MTNDLNEYSHLLPQNTSRSPSNYSTSNYDGSSYLLDSSNIRRLRSISRSRHDSTRDKSQDRGSRTLSRARTNSVAVFHHLEDSVISTVGTSYGPVVVIDTTIPYYGGVLGILLAVASGILFTGNNFLYQYFHLNATDMLMSRSTMQTALLGFILILTGCSSAKPVECFDWWLIVCQSLCSGARSGLTLLCLGFLPIGDALTIIFSEPLWTLVLAKLFLKTRVGWWKITFACVLIFGVVLCTKPPFIFGSSDDLKNHPIHHHWYHHNASTANSTDVVKPSQEVHGYYIGVLLAIGAAVTGSTSNILVSKCQDISSLAMVTYSGLGGVVLSGLYGVVVDDETKIFFSISSIDTREWLLLLLLGGMGLVGYFCLNRSLQLVPPTTVAVLRALEIVLAYGVQAAVLDEVPDPVAMAGSAFVIISVLAFAAENVLLPIGRNFCRLS